MFRRWLKAAEVASIQVDAPERLFSHAAVLKRKRLLRELFDEFHHLFLSLDRRYFGDTQGLRIEIGSGVAPVRESYPEVLATDVVAAPHLDRVLDAQAMDLPGNSVRAIYGQFCFHHIPEPERFFDEVLRVVNPGGGVILIEPYHGPAASLLFKRIFDSEGFDKDMPGWNVEMSGPMNGANQALSYVVFRRDFEIFRRKYPKLEIVHEEPLISYVRYLLSGGLNFRQIAPDVVTPVLRPLENALYLLRRILALHQVIVIKHAE